MTVVAALVALVVLGGAGKYAWTATEFRRVCPLQAADMQAIVPWTVTTTHVYHGADQYPFTECGFTEEYSGPYLRSVSLSLGETEAGATPGKPETCLKGWYWGGRGYVCIAPGEPVFSSGLPPAGRSGAALPGPDLVTGDIHAVRLNGDHTVSVALRCNESPTADGQLSRPVLQECLSQVASVMTSALSRLDVQPDLGVAQSPVDIDAAVAANGGGGGGGGAPAGIAEPGSDPSTTSPTDPPPTGPGVEPTPVATTETAPTSNGADDPQAQLEDLATQGAAALSLDGHWAIQLASKFDGITDKAQTSPTGSHTFHYADILQEFQRLKAAYPPEQVVLIHGSKFSTIKRNAKIYVTILDPGGLSSRAEALTWCKAHFPLTGDALLNVCYPRQLRLN